LPWYLFWEWPSAPSDIRSPTGASLAPARSRSRRLRLFLQPRPNPPRAIAHLTTELNLTPDQQKQIGDILADMQHRYDVVHDQMNPEFEQIREQGHDQIRQALTPEQRPKFEDFLRRVTEDRRRRAINPSAVPSANPK